MLNHILPVFLAVIVHILVGMLWYSPTLFGKIWMDLKNLNPDETGATIKDYAITISGAIITAVILNIFIHMPRVLTIYHALWVTFLVWAGFALTTQMLELSWGGKNFRVFLIDAAHQLVSLALMGTVLFLMK